MFGPKLGTVFASRWKALTWAVGIMITAYCSVPSDSDTAALSAVAAQVHDHQQAQSKPKSPWAVDTK